MIDKKKRQRERKVVQTVCQAGKNACVVPDDDRNYK